MKETEYVFAQQMADSGPTNNRYDKGSIKVNPDETSEIEFLTVAEIREKLVTEQQLFKSDYSAAFNEFCKYLKR